MVIWPLIGTFFVLWLSVGLLAAYGPRPFQLNDSHVYLALLFFVAGAMVAALWS
jgi:hypothetical protein